jgi:regulator of cell morphogenesis and NO signaling
MTTIDPHQTVEEITTETAGSADVFGSLGIDYRCAGEKMLFEACRMKGLDPDAVIKRLRRSGKTTFENSQPIDVMSMSLTELADHIENTHHAFLLEELPRLARLARDVAQKHGQRDPRLHQVQETFRGMAFELWSHMLKEEHCLFPMIRQLEASDQPASLHCGTIANPIRQMESEHGDADSALQRIRELTDGFAPPEWACKSYRGLLASLAYLETDMHEHIHKENNALFPNALKIEALRHRSTPVGPKSSESIEALPH